MFSHTSKSNDGAQLLSEYNEDEWNRRNMLELVVSSCNDTLKKVPPRSVLIKASAILLTKIILQFGGHQTSTFTSTKASMAFKSADGRNSYPDYVLSENQIASDENLALFKAALVGSITGGNA